MLPETSLNKPALGPAKSEVIDSGAHYSLLREEVENDEWVLRNKRYLSRRVK